MASMGDITIKADPSIREAIRMEKWSECHIKHGVASADTFLRAFDDRFPPPLKAPVSRPGEGECSTCGGNVKDCHNCV